MKKLMIANEAVARGAYEAGVRVVSSYPGTPSTEITEFVAKYDEIHAEWAPNEKVAAEVAIGASMAGARAMVCMKHVGLNVCADPLYTAAYTGVNAGLVFVVADDPAMHSSQNEQDTRIIARSAHVPVLEPSDSMEAKEMTRMAFELSEKYDTPVILRLTTRVAHSQSLVELSDRDDISLKEYVKDITKYVMMPAMAKGRHVAVENRENRLKSDCNGFEINRVEDGNDDIGIVTAGGVYQYVKECTDYKVFKLGLVYPLPIEELKKFAESVKRVVVAEELEPFIENQLKANGIECDGKNLFGLQGELSVAAIKRVLLGEEEKNLSSDLPLRPPVMCAGCPHRGVFFVLNKLKLTVTGDIGCYTLGASAPLSAMDSCVCMGASVGMAHGFDKAGVRKNRVVGVIGDSTFIHSGITGIINSVYNKGSSTVIILDNSITGMTGHQQNPATGKTLKNEPTYPLDLEALLHAVGVNRVRVVDSYNLSEVETAVREEIEKDEVSVIIARRPCFLILKNAARPAYKISDECKKCKACLKIGCPAIEYVDGIVRINAVQCVGCGVCAQLCKFNAIKGGDVNE